MPGLAPRPRRAWLLHASRAAMGVSAVTVGAPVARFLVPPSPKRPPEQPRTMVVCRASELRAGESRTVALNHRPVIVLRTADGSLRAFDATCTHLGCTVQYDAPRGVLHCACHGADFDAATGTARRGPATRPLAALTASTRHGRIIVES